MSNINLAAYNKLSDAFDYAHRVKNDPAARGGDTVVHLQGGNQLTCNYSAADAPRGILNLASRNQDKKDLNNATRNVFKQAVIDIFGTSINDVPKRVRDAMKLSKFDNTGRPLTARRILAVSNAIDAAMTAMAQKFGMTGAGSGSAFSFLTSNSDILQSQNPVREFKRLANRHATASIATHIVSRASQNLDYSSFEKDIERNMGLTLGGKRAPQNPAVARDMVVQFLTGRKNATFGTADAHTKRKAAILMSLLHQGSIACFMTGIGGAFDHEAKVSRLSVGELKDFGGTQHNSFAVTKDKAGNLTIKGQVTFSGRFILNMSNGTDYTNNPSDNNGVFATYKGTIKLSAADLDKLADADWTKGDFTQILATDNDDSIADRFKTAADMIPEPYKFTGSVDVSFKMHVNSLLQMSDLG
ncbi:MAG: hypothetical protein IKO40_01415 [Kiritimatiellae bacterium]|nr:hypothetical protein [Kiritimatiellia bacterium]